MDHKRPKTGRTARTFKKAELDVRRRLGPHQVQDALPEETPIPEAVIVQGLQKCRICNFSYSLQFVVCPMCHNCQYCGLYNMDDAWDNCYNCGNSLSEHKRIDVIVIPEINSDL